MQMNPPWFMPLSGIMALHVNNDVFTVQEKWGKIHNSVFLAISYDVQSANSDFCSQNGYGVVRAEWLPPCQKLFTFPRAVTKEMEN